MKAPKTQPNTPPNFQETLATAAVVAPARALPTGWIVAAIIVLASVLAGIGLGTALQGLLNQVPVARPGVVVTAGDPPFGLIQRAAVATTAAPQTLQVVRPASAMQPTERGSQLQSGTPAAMLQSGFSSYGLQGGVGTRAATLN